MPHEGIPIYGDNTWRMVRWILLFIVLVVVVLAVGISKLVSHGNASVQTSTMSCFWAGYEVGQLDLATMGYRKSLDAVKAVEKVKEQCGATSFEEDIERHIRR